MLFPRCEQRGAMEILVAIDFSDSTVTLIDNAKRIAKSSDSNIWLLHVAAPEPEFVGFGVGPQTERDTVAKGLHTEHKILQQHANALRKEGVDCTALLVQGATVDTILHEAEKLSAGMIILGTHGKSAVTKFFVGSTSEGILHRTSIPVLIIPTHKRS